MSDGNFINLGNRHSPVAEAGVKACDWWNEQLVSHPDGTLELTHVGGVHVLKFPGRRAGMSLQNRVSEAERANLANSIYFSWTSFQDDQGTVFVLNPQQDIGGNVIMFGHWEHKNGRRGDVSCAVYQPELKRVLLWFTYPDSQAYGSAVFSVDDNGNLNGSYMYGSLIRYPWRFSVFSRR